MLAGTLIGTAAAGRIVLLSKSLLKETRTTKRMSLRFSKGEKAFSRLAAPAKGCRVRKSLNAGAVSLLEAREG